MITSEIELSTTTTGSGLATSESKVLNKDDFLNLLITQLQNQDPLNPTDSVEFTAQLAQFSSLEQLANVNDNLLELKNFQASINNSQAVALIGKTITAHGNFVRLSNEVPAACDFNLEDDAAEVVATLYDSTGEFVVELTGQNMPAGQHSIYWNGIDYNGNRAINGNYTFEIVATDVNDQQVIAAPYFSGTVNKVMFENDTSFLISGDHKIALGDVFQVATGEKIENSDKPEPEAASPASQSSIPLINGGK